MLSMASQSLANDMEHDYVSLTTDNAIESSDNNKKRPTLPPISSMSQCFASKSWPPPSTSLSLAHCLPSNNTTNSSKTFLLSPPPTSSFYRTDNSKLPLSPATEGNERSTDYFNNTQQNYRSSATTRIPAFNQVSPSHLSSQQQSTQGCLSPSSPSVYSPPHFLTTAHDWHGHSYRSTSSTYQQHSDPDTSIHPDIPTTTTRYNSNIPSQAHPAASYSLLSTSTLQNIDREIDQVINNCNAVSEHMHLKRASIYRIEDYFCDANLMRPWLDDMIGKSNEILNALLRLRKHQIAAEQARLHRITTSTSVAASHHYHSHQRHYSHPQHSHDNHESPDGGRGSSASHIQQEGENWASLNFASSSGVLALNSSLRKRGKRPGFQGRCHSCNISETPEWRRGPNGARTLCNACGLHYAKLNRKKSRHQQEQQNSSSNNNYAIKTETVHMMDEDDRTMR